ncbi:NXPE family member 4-like isoform X2 [Mizuhopecten yessoensis]|uniref:NXPE family member 4 n=1 Tax=Mizuhopecten yessoensis TaxID=6573 RepID=A0A210QE73_MIZYE|nr:NXPE family member 4-like isoform X2 [Mizuhopecten yessoensis]OWF47045.1 NXPE family member 4 [Mizuhopecten yessoensis]
MDKRSVFVGLVICVLILVISLNFVLYSYYDDSSFQHIATERFIEQISPDYLAVFDNESFNKMVQNISASDFAASVSKTFLSSYKAYLSINDVTDLKRIATGADSTQALALNKEIYSLGDIIKVRIMLFDGYGKPLTNGGDILRIWLKSTSKNASANGYVIDHGNGSYTGHVRALWTGSCVIKTSIAATKEHIAIVHKYIEKHGLLHDMVAGFNKNNIQERTPCSVKPNVFGLADMCNFTEENYGLHWFCGKPKNSNLTCQDWKFTKGHRTDHLSQPQRTIARLHKHMLLKKSPAITIKGDGDYVLPPDLPCNKRPNKETWYEESPVGFYYKNKWHNRGCDITFVPSKVSYEKCLRDQYLFLIGDSNIRSWFDHIKQTVTMVTAKHEGQTASRWFSLRRAERKDLNLTLLWAVHELPFYTGEDSPREHIKSVAWHIDRIPERKKVTVVIHNMMHIARTTPSEFRLHVRDVKFAIGRLFKRIPEARVFVKGPHSATFIDLLKPLDFIRKIHEQLFYEEFGEFQDKITYLNYWDMTACIENVNVHPSPATVSDMINYFMSYLCGV